MHILFLTDNFPPEVNAPASRTFEHCREWVRAGQRVTVVTCAPNFPAGKVYEGYKNRLWQMEWMDGIRVVRVWSYITANEGFIKRILDYVSFMATAVLAAPFIHKVDLVIGTSPHFFTVCGVYLVSRMKRVPFVFELRDIWPESIKAVGAMGDSPVIRLLEKVEMFLYWKAARIVSVTESFKRILIGRGVDGHKIAVITYRVDQKRSPGQYFLTGSQVFQLMQGVSESLAGRCAVLNLHTLSLTELLDAGQSIEEASYSRKSHKLFASALPPIFLG